MMAPLKLHWKYVEYKLARPFQLSYGTYHSREGLILGLEDADSKLVGHGEMIFVQYYHQDKKAIDECLVEIKTYLALRKIDIESPSLFYALEERLSDQPFLLSALDCALWDLRSKKVGQPLWSTLGADKPQGIITAYTISSIEDIRDNPEYWDFPILKIKMGHKEDLALLQEVIQTTDSRLILDANRGWDITTALDVLYHCPADRILYLEEPLEAHCHEQYNELKKRLPTIPILADESCQNMGDLLELPAYFDAINIKIMKCGGLTPGLAILEKAREKNLQVVGGCMTGSSISVLPIVHLYTGLDHLDADGSVLLSEDPWQGMNFDKGNLYLNEKPGLGLNVEPSFDN